MTDNNLFPPLSKVYQLPPADDNGCVAAELIGTRTLDFVYIKFKWITSASSKLNFPILIV